MRFQHCSIPADEPKKVAEVIAKIFKGEVTRFPPAGPNAWMAWSPDGTLQMECTPRGLVMAPDEGKVILKFQEESVARHSEVHIATCVEISDAEIIAIADEVGWPAYSSVRIPGEKGFSILEFWVEGKFLLEFLDPVQTARLEKAVTIEGWKQAFGLD